MGIENTTAPSPQSDGGLVNEDQSLENNPVPKDTLTQRIEEVIHDTNGFRVPEEVLDTSIRMLSAQFRSDEYSWRGMKKRCKEQGYELHPSFTCFRNFLRIMGRKPDPSYTLDRTDPNNPEYSPANCVWASKQQQTENRITTRMIYVRGEMITVPEASRRYGVNAKTIRSRIRDGWDEESAATISAGMDRPLDAVPDSAPGHAVPTKRMMEHYRELSRLHFGLPHVTLSGRDIRDLSKFEQLLRESGADPLRVLTCCVSEWSRFVEVALKLDCIIPAHPDAETIDAEVYRQGLVHRASVEFLLEHADTAANFETIKDRFSEGDRFLFDVKPCAEPQPDVEVTQSESTGRFRLWFHGVPRSCLPDIRAALDAVEDSRYDSVCLDLICMDFASSGRVIPESQSEGPLVTVKFWGLDQDRAEMIRTALEMARQSASTHPLALVGICRAFPR